MSKPIDRISIKGYRSFRHLEEFELGKVNVLIGANGVGKSNFVSVFHFLREIVEGNLALTVNRAGGADSQLFLGPKVTTEITLKLEFGSNGYEFSLVPTSDNRLVFADERVKFHGDRADVDWSIGTGQNESNLKASSREQGKREQQICSYIYEAISSWVVYHFHDTSHTAALRRKCSVRDVRKLRSDGSNLAAFLFFLKTHHANRFDLICESVRLVTPFFDSFRLLPNREESGDETVELEWLQKGSDYPFHPSQLSDGTIRFIALTTALLQPHPPSTILIDEPELGLHPFALDVLANLILQASARTQVIVSTQSAPLLNAFEPDQIVVMDRVEGESRMRRLESTSLESWLDQEYTLGELWQKNVYGGGPAYE